MNKFLKQKDWNEMIIKGGVSNLIINTSLLNFTLTQKFC